MGRGQWREDEDPFDCGDEEDYVPPMRFGIFILQGVGALLRLANKLTENRNRMVRLNKIWVAKNPQRENKRLYWFVQDVTTAGQVGDMVRTAVVQFLEDLQYRQNRY